MRDVFGGLKEGSPCFFKLFSPVGFTQKLIAIKTLIAVKSPLRAKNIFSDSSIYDSVTVGVIPLNVCPFIISSVYFPCLSPPPLSCSKTFLLQIIRNPLLPSLPFILSGNFNLPMLELLILAFLSSSIISLTLPFLYHFHEYLCRLRI